MRPARYLMALGSASLVGCFSARPSAPDNFMCLAVRNSVEAPIRGRDEIKFIEAVRKEARRCWDLVCVESGRSFSKDYREGFMDGFVDYVEAGGTGEPPYLPPFRYRLTPNRTPEGQAAIEDWYAGWRHGANVAKRTGLREANIVPLPGPAVPADPNAVLNSSSLPPRPSAAPEEVPNTIPPSDRPGKLPLPNPIPQPVEIPPAPAIALPPSAPIALPPSAPIALPPSAPIGSPSVPNAGAGSFPKRVSDPSSGQRGIPTELPGPLAPGLLGDSK